MNDFTVVTHPSRWGTPDVNLWAVVTGGDDVVSVGRDESKMIKLAADLNADPWFLDRGYTKQDRCAGL